tara:strand:+ start:10100 stop:10288 length:189 start_codon:yes stop_codon:yes gene_type:complete
MDIANIIEQVERYGALRRGGYEDDATKQLEDIRNSLDLLTEQYGEKAVLEHIKRESDWTPRR